MNDDQPITLRDAGDVMRLISDPKRRATHHVLLYPDAAATLLELNRRPRRLDKRRVEGHVQAIRGGTWLLTTSGIGIDWDGDLSNGQHRLTACVETGHAIEITVHTGLDPASRYVEDTGKPRSFHDTLMVSGLAEHATSIDAAVARLIWRYEHGLLLTTGRDAVVPNDLLVRYVEDVITGSELHRVGNVGKALKKRIPGGNATALGAFSYLVRRDPDRSEAFVGRVATGAGLSEHDPELTLRTLVANRVRGDNRGAPYQLAVIVKAWNARQLGRQLRYLTVRADEAQPVIIFT